MIKRRLPQRSSRPSGKGCLSYRPDESADSFSWADAVKQTSGYCWRIPVGSRPAAVWQDGIPSEGRAAVADLPDGFQELSHLNRGKRSSIGREVDDVLPSPCRTVSVN